MKKGENNSKEKGSQALEKKGLNAIKFNLSQSSLACFKANKIGGVLKHKQFARQTLKEENKKQMVPQRAPLLCSMTEPLRDRPRISSCFNVSNKIGFNQKVVFMHYNDIDVYIDNSARKKSSQSNRKSSGSNRKNSDQDQNQLVQSCVRVITQETDITANQKASLYRHLTPPRHYNYTEYDLSDPYYQPKNRTPRNRRAVSKQQSKDFTINYSLIEKDGRTTIMVRNIPNKYTQDMLLQEFSVNHAQTFDFFYLPIDKNNDCNIGYAFVNFIEPKSIKAFYEQFHKKKWKNYKSPKICILSYATYQGTLQLANHFRDTKTLQQKDKRLRPLTGSFLACRIKELKEIQQIAQSQRNRD